MIQLEISPFSDIYIAPNIVKSKCPPLIIPNEVAESYTAAPGFKVILSFPAFIKSACSYPSLG